MSSVSNILLEKEILLESGTNELEILVFRLGDYTFGINVAKVREVLPRGPITNLPKAHASVLGVFRLREVVVPVVSLRRHLQVPEGDFGSDQTLILADFNQQQTAFVVDAVERIHRLSWEQILAVPAISSLAHSPVTAVARIEQRLVIMLDFEMITDQVTEQFFRTGAVANPLSLPRGELRILLADDSPTVREAVGLTLRSSGYTQLNFFENGREAWNWIEAQLAAGKPLADFADLLISDVEMPQIDGLHLTKKIKEHPVLKSLPVLLYSSIVTPDNHKKGKAVGADAQISKPELGKVVELADNLIAASLARSIVPDSLPSSPAVTPATPVQHAPTAAGLQHWLTPPASQTKAEQEPAWPLDDDPPPSESNPRVWQTFRAELADRARNLKKLCERVVGEPDSSLYQETFRTLHTIKSAAMVVPVGEVSHLTHWLEGALEAAHLASSWPSEILARYTQWLLDLSSPSNEVARELATGRKLYDAWATKANSR